MSRGVEYTLHAAAMLFDSSGNEYGVDDSYDDSDSDNGCYSSTYRSDMEDTVNVPEKKEPEIRAAMSSDKGVVSSLFQQAANVIGARLPFEAVELWAQRLGKKMADEVQLAIMKASFPVDKGLIRRCAYLSRITFGNNEFSYLFQQPTGHTGNHEFAVEDAIQIGEWLRQHDNCVDMVTT